MEWHKRFTYYLGGTYLVLTPQTGTELWYVGDWRDPEMSFGDALPLNDAKRKAERLVKERPDLIDPVPRFL